MAEEMRSTATSDAASPVQCSVTPNCNRELGEGLVYGRLWTWKVHVKNGIRHQARAAQEKLGLQAADTAIQVE